MTSSENQNGRGLFDNVPALLPDWSNAASVFHYIDYDLFANDQSKRGLSEMATLLKVEDFDDRSWYAVRMYLDQWWVIYVQDGEWYTIGESLFQPGMIGFRECMIMGEAGYAVPIKKGLFPNLPDELMKNASGQTRLGAFLDARAPITHSGTVKIPVVVIDSATDIPIQKPNS